MLPNVQDSLEYSYYRMHSMEQECAERKLVCLKLQEDCQAGMIWKEEMIVMPSCYIHVTPLHIHAYMHLSHSQTLHLTSLHTMLPEMKFNRAENKGKQIILTYIKMYMWKLYKNNCCFAPNEYHFGDSNHSTVYHNECIIRYVNLHYHLQTFLGDLKDIDCA